MTSQTISKETIMRLEAMGWAFYPSGPNEYEWMKFKGDTRVARGGEETWFRDLDEAEAPPKTRRWWRPW